MAEHATAGRGEDSISAEVSVEQEGGGVAAREESGARDAATRLSPVMGGCAAKVPTVGRPVRVLCITLGGERQRLAEEMYGAVGGFELGFHPGVSAMMSFAHFLPFPQSSRHVPTCILFEL